MLWPQPPEKTEMAITRQNLFFAVSLIGIFCVSFAVMWHQRNGAERPLPKPVVSGESVMPPTFTPPPAQPAPAVVEMPRAPAPPPAAATVPQQSKYDGPELPVVFNVTTRRVYTIEDGPDGEPVNVTKNVTEGILTSSADRPLTINVTEVNSQTHEKSQAQIMLAQNMQKRFGVDQGLGMLSGDEITLRNPAYRELTQQIP